MSVRVRDVLMQHLDSLRHEPTDKRIRASLDGVLDQRRGRLFLEFRLRTLDGH